ncbi:MAG: hypothetical protein V1692_01925 [bacterium]
MKKSTYTDITKYEFSKDLISEVVADFKTTNLYNEKFLMDLEDGLEKSSYMNNYAPSNPSR